MSAPLFSPLFCQIFLKSFKLDRHFVRLSRRTFRRAGRASWNPCAGMAPCSSTSCCKTCACSRQSWRTHWANWSWRAWSMPTVSPAWARCGNRQASAPARQAAPARRWPDNGSGWNAKRHGSHPGRELLPVFHRLEARSDIRGGSFVAGFSGEQFAMPEVILLMCTAPGPWQLGMHLRQRSAQCVRHPAARGQRAGPSRQPHPVS